MIPLLRGVVIVGAIALLSLCAFVPFYSVALVRALVPVGSARRKLARALVRIAELWAGGVRGCFRYLSPTELRIRQRHELAALDSRGRYLVIANHRSWADIFVLLDALHGHVPFPRFFIKRALGALPFFGAACWALDFPIMRRYSREHLERHPEDRGQDLETTRRACEKFRKIPITLVNFVEGTRFRPSRQQAQKPPYRHLLKPKSGGLSLALQVMGDELTAILDLTLRYPPGEVSFWRFVSGALPWVEVTIRVFPVPVERDQEGVREWLHERWMEKDALLEGTPPGRKP